MRSLVIVASVLLFVAAAPCLAQDLLTNGSFESGITDWTTDPSYPASLVLKYSGVNPSDGSKFVVLPGAANVGYTYVRIVSKDLSAPFGTVQAADNFVVYLFASTYLHTNDGRNVSFALTLNPGYGQAGSTFHQGPQDSWTQAQTWGYYINHDPFDASAPAKPLTVSLELRDSLQPGEFLAIDDIHLYYGGPGIPEPSSSAAVLMGICGIGLTIARKGRR